MLIASEFLKGISVADASLYLAVFGTVCYIFLVLAMIAGGDFDGLDDVDADMDGNFLNLSLGAFFSFTMGWGWFSYAAIAEFKMSNLSGVIVGLIGGALITFLHSFLRVMVKKAEHKVEMKTVAEGDVGTCYLKIEPGTVGKVIIKGREVEAVSDDTIPSHAKVKVVKESRLDEIITVTKV